MDELFMPLAKVKPFAYALDLIPSGVMKGLTLAILFSFMNLSSPFWIISNNIHTYMHLFALYFT